MLTFFLLYSEEIQNVSTVIKMELIIPYIPVGAGFEHCSYRMNEFKPNEPNTMNL